MTRFSNYVLAVFLLLFSQNFASAQGSLVFYNDEQTFFNSCRQVALEDFEDTIAPQNSVTVCPGPINSTTSDSCFVAGALLPGFTMSSVGGGSDEVIVLTPPRAGVSNVAAGSNNSGDDTVITFDPSVRGVGMSIINIATPGLLVVDVFGPGNVLLGSTTLDFPTSTVAQFLGVTTTDSISRIELISDQESSEVLYDLSFGQCDLPSNVPTLSEWGLIVMAALIGIVGFMVIRRRKVAT